MILANNLDQIILVLICFLIIMNSLLMILSNSMLGLITLLSTFSVGISILYLLMDAPDVAMTEVALGCALSTVILLSFGQKIAANSLLLDPLSAHSKNFSSFIIAVVLIIALSIVGINLPDYGDATAPIHTNVNKFYIENTAAQIKIPSMIAAILASYRGYDTLGETLVILIAGCGVLLILRSCKDAD